MKFDSSDFEKKSKTTLNTLDQLNDKLSFKDAANSDSLEAITDNVQKIANKAYTIVDRMVDKIKDNIANKLVNFLQENTIGQLQAGWSKYADMTTSVATLKSQGYAMERITDQLERLNYFTDETSYNFTAMVSEIGKFTASGQSLEDATTAMMGIAEWAALSGKNANDASRAMYQLSQALGSGTMRLIDYKSIQNLNMDTIEFRQNAIEAAIAVGTLKDNLDGTYTSLVDNKTTFAMQQFAESLSGKWFNSKVMMTTYKKYSEAVDEIRAIYEEGSYMDAQGRYVELNTTADAVKEVKKNNEYLVKQFEKTELDDKQITKLLSKWKKVEKVTDETLAEYMEMNKITDKTKARTEMQKNYSEYLKEYAETFKNAEKSAEEALDDWHTYVSEFGVKAFLSAQEAKTFTDAIESAKDAASTVWTTIYTNVFGNYEEAKELWTDLANSLYEIFVDRLWDLNDVFEYWRSGGKSALESTLDQYEKELASLEKKTSPVQADMDRMRLLHSEIARLNEELENTVFVDGRTKMFQGLYAFGAGLKSIIFNFRTGWDQVTEDNIGGKKLLSFSEKLRVDGFRFYNFMVSLGQTSFFRNMAQGIKNLLAPIKGVIAVVSSAVGQFLPKSKTLQDALNDISSAFKNLTSKIVPSQETLQKFARILRGIIAVIKLIGKAVIGVYRTYIKPVLDILFNGANKLFGGLLDGFAKIGDALFYFEEGLEPLEAMQVIAKVVGTLLRTIGNALKSIASTLLTILAPAINIVVGTVQDLVGKLKNLFTGGKGNLLENVADGFNNISNRAKKAWKSTESFADIFKRFKGGSGISNFIKMVGEMLDNLITRIGRTILAIFGLEDVINDGSAGRAFNTLKDVLTNAFTVISWIYTSIIRPTLETLFIGTANMFKEVGNAFREGDIMKILEIITKTFKALGSLQLFKVLTALSRTFGSAGIIKVLRNGAKALKSLSKWLGAKALNETSSAIVKLVVGFTLLLGVLTAMSFLPTENLERVSQMLIYAGIALGVMMVAMTTLSIVATKTRWGLVGIAGSMIAIVAATWTFIFVIEKIRQAVERFQEDVEGFGGILMAIAPIIAVLAAMFIVFKAAAKIGNSGGLLAFSVGIMALGVAVFAMTGALSKMVNFMQENPAEDVVAAILGIIIIMTAVAVASGLMLRITGSAMQNIKKTSAALAMGLTIAAMAITMALVVMPLLEDMVQHSDKFPQYLQAIVLFASTMISISAAFALMTSRTKGGLHMLAAGLVFRTFVGTIQAFILPMLESLKGMNLGDYLEGIIAMGALMVAISYGVRQILEGIASMIVAISKINPKSWIAIIVSTGAVIAGVILLTHYLESAGSEISVGAVFAAIGVVLAIIGAFGLFAYVLINKTGADGNVLGGYTLEQLAKVFKWMSLLVTAIMVGLAGTLIAIKLLYADNPGAALKTIAGFAAIVLATLALTLTAFGAWIIIISNALSIIDSATLGKTVGLMVAAFVGMAAIMTVISIWGIILASIFDDIWDFIGPLAALVTATLVLVWGTLLGIAVFMNLMPTLTFNKEACVIVIAALTAVLLDILAIGLILVPAFEKIRDIDWRIILSVLGGVALVMAAVGVITTMVSTSKDVDSALKGLLGALGTLLAIGLILPLIAKGFEAFNSVEVGSAIMALLALIVPLGGLYLLTKAFVKDDLGTAFLGTAAKISGAIIMISLALAALAVSIAAVIELFNPGSTWLSMGLGIANGAAEGVKEGSENYTKAIGEMSKDGTDEFKDDNNMNSPSKLYRKYGKFIDQGLAQGITKNRKLAVKAASGLAIFTNDSFCEELGIASPSKVFYENGRFVVRGFINGLNDESNKNKKAGADMAEGFADGMGNTLDKIKEEFKGLWGDSNLDEEAAKAGETAGEGFWDFFKNSLLGEDEVVEELTDTEKQTLAKLKEERKKALKEWDDAYTGNKQSQQYAIDRKAFLDGYSDELNKLEEKASKKVVKNTGLKGLLQDAFGGALDGVSKDGNFLEKIAGFGTMIGSGFSDSVNTFVEENLGIKLGGEKGGLTQAFEKLTGDTNIQSSVEALGNKFGEGIKSGIGSILDKYNPFSNIELMAETAYERIKNIFTGADNRASVLASLSDILESKSTIYGWENDQNKLYNEFLKVYNNSGNVSLDPSNVEDILRTIYNDGLYGRTTETTKIVKGMFGDYLGLEGITGVSHVAVDAAKNKAALLNSDIDWKTLLKSSDYYTFKNYIADLLPFIRGSVIDEWVNEMETSGHRGEHAYELDFLDDELNRAFMDKNFRDKFLYNGIDIIKFLFWGMEEGYMQYEDGVLKAANGNAADIILAYYENFKEHSPSKVAIGIMKFFMEGLKIGIDDNTQEVLNSVGTSTDLMTDATVAGMNGMLTALEEDVQPTITPIFDADTIRNGVSSLNNSFSGLSPQMQATIDSFHDDSPNYNNQLAMLATSINNTNMLVTALINMLAEGDIVTINVQTESDPNNIYETVVNTNRQKFRQTGKNPLAY